MAHTQPLIAAPYGTDTQNRLREYKTDFELALDGEAIPDIVQRGHQLTSAALEEKWPISTGDLVFDELVAGVPNLARFGTIFLTMVTKEYGAGAVISADVLRSVEWLRRGWGTAPAKGSRAWLRLMAECVAAALEAGRTTASFEGSGKYIFDTTKPADPADPNNGASYDNLHTSTALSIDNILAMRLAGRTQDGPVGKPRNYALRAIVAGADLEDSLRTYLADDMVLATFGSSSTETGTMVKNKLKKYAPIEPIILPYLTTSGIWFPIFGDEGATGDPMPWLTLVKLFADSGQQAGVPGPNLKDANGLEWMEVNETSDAYREGGKWTKAGELAMIAKGRVGSAIVEPWKIHCCTP